MRGPGSDILLVYERTAKAGAQAVVDLLRQLRQAGKITRLLTPYALRHRFATRALEVTEDLAVVQDLLGHVSPATTRVYTRVSSRRLREAHREVFRYEGWGEE